MSDSVVLQQRAQCSASKCWHYAKALHCHLHITTMGYVFCHTQRWGRGWVPVWMADQHFWQTSWQPSCANGVSQLPVVQDIQVNGTPNSGQYWKVHTGASVVEETLGIASLRTQSLCRGIWIGWLDGLQDEVRQAVPGCALGSQQPQASSG